MADQVEVDVKVNVNKGDLDKLGNEFKKLGDTGETSFERLDKTSRAWLNDFTPLVNQTQGRLANGWENAKSKITGLGNSIKTKLGGAFNSVRGRFSGLVNQIRTGSNGMAKSMGFVSSAASMTVGMIGFELVNGMIQASRESINAAGRMQAFGKRLGMTAQEIDAFSKECDTLQTQFKKVDMRAVGASATELGVKLGIPKSQMGELTKMTAVMSSAFVNEGRSQEDAILAVSDAMDGQFKRLQELGITQDKLKANGWNGNLEDTNSLMQAMNKTMESMGFTETAKGIYSLDDAYQALTVAGGRLLADVLIPLTPYITAAIDAIISGIDGVKKVIGDLANLWNSLPDWAQMALGIGAVALSVGALAGFIGEAGILAVPLIGSLISGLGTILGLVMGISWPVVAVVAAIGLLVVAFEQLGEWLGWWDSFGGMIESVKAGVLRLWNAFINSKTVQAWLEALKASFNVLRMVVGAIFSWISSAWSALFGEGGGSPDAIQMIIDAFTVLDNVISTLIGIATTFMNIIYGVMSGNMSIYEGIIAMGNTLMPFALAVGNGLLTIVTTMFSMLISVVTSAFTSLVSAVASWASNMVSRGINAIRSFVNSIISGLSSLPGRFGSALQNVISAVINWGSQLISRGQQIVQNFANTIANGVKGALNNIPGVSLGFDMGFGGDAGFNEGNTLNNTLASTISNNNATTVNLNLKGIIDKDASTYIVDAVNDHVRTQSLIRGV